MKGNCEKWGNLRLKRSRISHSSSTNNHLHYLLLLYNLLMEMLTLKEPVPYTGPTSAANRGSTHLRRTRAEFVPHSPRSWPALEPRLCPIAGRRKPRFNREVSEPRLCQEPQAAFPVWVPRFQATGPRYTSRKSCVHTFMPYSTCLIGNLPVFI